MCYHCNQLAAYPNISTILRISCSFFSPRFSTGIEYRNVPTYVDTGASKSSVCVPSNMCVQESLVESQTLSHWNLTGHSMLSPSSILPSSICAFVPATKNSLRFQKCYFINFNFFKLRKSAQFEVAYVSKCMHAFLVFLFSFPLIKSYFVASPYVLWRLQITKLFL